MVFQCKVAGVGVLTTLIQVNVILVGAYLIAGGNINISDLITFLLYIGVFTEPIRALVDFTEQFQNGYSGFERFREIMDIEPDIQDKEGAVELGDVKGNIRFDAVSFKYNENADKVLKNVSLDITAGAYYALVGSSGAGKTTLCSLIPRFYDVTGGSIYIDGKDIRDVTLKSLRENIGIVQQDVYLFAGTIYENIAYGKPGCTREEVIAAAKEANAHEFIMSFPDGYDTDIGQRGIKLSGGQKQRLSVARVFLKNPPILIFDEATSALDNESERVVQESLEKLAKNRTTLVIAHRLTTIQNAEKILVLTEEGIAESGTHQELLDKGGEKGLSDAYKLMHVIDSENLKKGCDLYLIDRIDMHTVGNFDKRILITTHHTALVYNDLTEQCELAALSEELEPHLSFVQVAYDFDQKVCYLFVEKFNNVIYLYTDKRGRLVAYPFKKAMFFKLELHDIINYQISIAYENGQYFTATPKGEFKLGAKEVKAWEIFNIRLI